MSSSYPFRGSPSPAARRLLGLLAALAAVGCAPRTPPPARVAARGTAEDLGPRVRVGKILRLARAGIIEEQRLPSGETAVVALVPAARRATSWQRGLDTQGNQFRVAPGGRLVPDGEPNPDREPASEANVAFYYAQALGLLEARRRREGLVMAAEVLDLPPGDPVVATAQRHLCSLFGRLAIQGEVRARLYKGLVAISHRAGAGVEVRNHAHGFALRMELGWRLLAGAVPNQGPDTTALVIALPSASGGEGEARDRVNLLWTTSQAPATGRFADWAKARRLATAGSQVTPVPLAAPSGARASEALLVEPLEYQGRSLSSLQLFFTERGLLHHVALLAPDRARLEGARPLLAALVASFTPGPWPWPCPPPPRPR